ncbi:sushi domain-containing protein 5 [Rhinatrema bivittatum]|uniref:sushi domain-containing protein 5 n=1 Tax=Rhinatrema bivittatum TaxID=194408 RepID=UPI0011268BD3|nr:sushi domain-containing protein 5 [Rhinatrema bivittatum]
MALTSLLGMGYLLSLVLISARADGKLFRLESKNGSQGLDLLMAQKSCAALGSHLATAEELQRAMQDCSFTVCTRGWLADGTVGTTVCSKSGSGPLNLKAINVKTETDASPSDRYDAFCVKDEDKPCGDPPSFPHTALHGHTGYEMGDELLYVCSEGYIMGNQEAAFTLLCDTCGEWYGQVQACVKATLVVTLDNPKRPTGQREASSKETLQGLPYSKPPLEFTGATSRARTTVCSKSGSGPLNLKAINVKTETDASPSDRYDAFCVKDEDKPCGDPPSFPHTALHGHTGYEMGDELLYVCSEGYVMGNQEAAFTLLCDTCGEWYGQVQACVKDATEAHIDYDDNFPYHSTMPVVEPNQDDGEEDAEEEEGQEEEEDEQDFSLLEDTGLKSDKGETQGYESTETESKTPTESPVSLLSQKHLFWFPSEAFSEPESEKETDFGTKAQFSNGDNRIGAKTDYTEPGTKMIYENEDFPLGPSTVNETNSAKDVMAGTDESWLDGYPVTQDFGQGAEKTDAPLETDEDVILTTKQPYNAEMGKVHPAPALDRDLTTVWAAPTRMLDYGVKVGQEPLTPTSGPENVSTSKGVDEVMRYHPSTPHGLTTEASAAATGSSEHTKSAPTAIMHTFYTVRPVDHIPLPTEPEETTTYRTPSETERHTVGISDSFTDASSFEGASEGDDLTGRIRGTLLPSSEPCVAGDCLRSSNGPMITIIVVVICLLLLATILAVWCYKKRQQKSSVYQLNGKGQTRHHQQIEMQKV